MSTTSAASTSDVSKTISPPAADAAPGRLVSLDALRGFDMFWILGGDAAIIALGAMGSTAPLKFLAAQFEHREWAGLACYDLIFPLFVFIAGASLVFSLTRLVEQRGRAEAVKRVLRRGALLFLLGLFYSGGISNRWPDVRLLGVLQRIALAYAGAGLLFCFLRPRALAGMTAALLVGYWALLTFVPIRDIALDKNAMIARLGPKPTPDQVRAAYDATTARVSGRYEPGLNLTNHVDFGLLGGRKYDTYWDPEGLLSTFPAIATCLLGVVAGLLLRRTDIDPAKKLTWLVAGGLAALALGWGWHLQFPVVKKIWTSSFVLVTAGWSALLLAGFHYVVDVRQWRGWCQPFVWIGMNPITLYLISPLLGFRRLGARFVGGDVKAFFDSAVAKGCGDFVIALAGMALMLWLARFLYRRQLFLRV